jgi:hypothetical protein
LPVSPRASRVSSSTSRTIKCAVLAFGTGFGYPLGYVYGGKHNITGRESQLRASVVVETRQGALAIGDLVIDRRHPAAGVEAAGRKAIRQKGFPARYRTYPTKCGATLYPTKCGAA